LEGFTHCKLYSHGQEYFSNPGESEVNGNGNSDQARDLKRKKIVTTRACTARRSLHQSEYKSHPTRSEEPISCMPVSGFGHPTRFPSTTCCTSCMYARDMVSQVEVNEFFWKTALTWTHQALRAMMDVAQTLVAKEKAR
jgi:hypothetical protein